MNRKVLYYCVVLFCFGIVSNSYSEEPSENGIANSAILTEIIAHLDLSNFIEMKIESSRVDSIVVSGVFKRNEIVSKNIDMWMQYKMEFRSPDGIESEIIIDKVKCPTNLKCNKEFEKRLRLLTEFYKENKIFCEEVDRKKFCYAFNMKAQSEAFLGIQTFLGYYYSDLIVFENADLLVVREKTKKNDSKNIQELIKKLSRKD